MSHGQDKRLVHILPEKVIDYAWGLTVGYSESDVKFRVTSADDIQNQLKQIRNDVQQQVLKRERALDEAEKALEEARKAGDSAKIRLREQAITAAETEYLEQHKDLDYVDNIVFAIDACERNLLTIIRGRNQNFEQTDSLMKTQIANIESSARLTKDLHSAVPRLFATGGGAGGTVLVNFILQSVFNYQIPDLVLASAAGIVASAFYGIFQWKVAPENVRRAQQEIIKNDYRRGIYYRQYISRTFSALSALFDQTLLIYENVYKKPYQPDRYRDVKNRQEVVWTVLGGQKGICAEYCPLIHLHYHDDKITPHVWSSCETAEGYKQCKINPEREAVTTKTGPI